MQSSRTATTRILSARPLRPPSSSSSSSSSSSHPRLFTQNSPLLLTIQRSNAPRPQLPYLTQPALKRTSPYQQQLARLLSTETRTYVKEQTYLAIKWTVIPCTLLFLGSIVYFGYSIEVAERDNPTPEEWTFTSRHTLRGARHFADPSFLETMGFIDWAKVGERLQRLLTRLEDPQQEGKGLSEPAGEGEGIVIPGVGRAGFDISAKSWPWRAGYFEVIMGCATAAEHLEGMVMDKDSGNVFQKEYVIGPSNPDPRPTPAYMKVVPLEENVVPAFDRPETYYMRILTGKGFTTKQKMEAARAYANWLDFKKLSESAEEMLRWELDIAKAALPLDAKAEDVIDSKTGVLKDGEAARNVTPNILRASTDLAVHFASNGNVAAALPIFLSVLRARRTAPVSPFPSPEDSHEEESVKGMTGIISAVLGSPKFPPPPPSGDNPLIRTSDKPTCEESALMLYIGEIIFASRPSRDAIGWTRQAVTIADASLAQPTSDAAEKAKCKECLMTGLNNWEMMLANLAASKEDKSSGGWFGWGAAKKDDDVEVENDLMRIAKLKDRVVRERIGLQIGPTAAGAGWGR